MAFKSYKRFFIFLFCYGMITSFCISQNDSVPSRKPRREPKEPFADRIFWGGTIGAWFGNPTYADVSPLIGYRITKKFSTGVGAIYNYYSYRYNNYNYTSTFYGGRIMARYFILENIFVQAGYDRINRDNPYSIKPNARIWVENYLVGGGIRYQISDNIFCVATGLWNLNDTPLSPYRNPIIQIGFVGGF